jgi:hypothetical protein
MAKRRRAAGKSRHRQIETAPEDMHGAALRAEGAIDLQKDPPEMARIFGIISCMGSLLAKTNWVRDLVGPLTNFHFYPEVSQTCHHGHIKIRYRLRGET